MFEGIIKQAYGSIETATNKETQWSSRRSVLILQNNRKYRKEANNALVPRDSSL
jgi:hypothetical protein